MEALIAWVKNFLILILVLTFLEMLLPSSGIRQFVKWLMGLVVMAFILQSVVDLESKSQLPEWEKWIQSHTDLRSTRSVLDMGQQIAEGGEEPVLELMQKEQSRYIKSMLLMLDGVDDAEVVIQVGSGGKLQGVVVTVKAASDVTLLSAGEGGVRSVQIPPVEISGQCMAVQPETDSVGGREHSGSLVSAEALSRKVRRFVASFYQLPESAVTVVVQN